MTNDASWQPSLRYPDPSIVALDPSFKRYHLALIPFLLEGVAGDPALIQDDGLHPRAKAQPRILDNVWPTLEPLLQQP